MKYCRNCGRFFEEGRMVDDGLQDSRFPDANGNRVFIEVCPACGEDSIEEMGSGMYVVADSRADIAHVCFSVYDIPEGVRLLQDEAIDIDDIVVYAEEDMENGDDFGRLV